MEKINLQPLRIVPIYDGEGTAVKRYKVVSDSSFENILFVGTLQECEDFKLKLIKDYNK